MFNLAELFVTISAKDDALQKSLGGVRQSLSLVGAFAKGLNPFAGWEREVDKTKKSVGALDVAIGNLAASAIGRATSALSGFFSRGIAGAADLGESISKVDAVFGASSGKIKGMADDMARSFGLPKLALIDGATAIGMIGKAAGQSQDAAAGLGVKLAKAAADASSFYDVPLDVALEKIRSGLVGQSEPLLAFGVLLNEEAVAAEAVAMGLAKSAREVDQQAKVMARASLITKGLGDATGDLARTIDSPKNQWRKFAGTLENTSDAIGTSLMPAISAVTTALGDMASRVASSVEANKDSIKDWADSIAGAIRAVPDAWDSFVAGLAVAFLKVEEWSTNVMAVFAVIPENLSRIGSWIGNNWTKMIADAVNAVGTAFSNLGDNLKGLGAAIVAFLKDPTKGFQFNWTPLLDGFKATTDQLPELLRPNLVSMDGAIAAVGEDLARKIGDRAKAAAAAQKAATAPGKKAGEQAAGKARDFKSEASSVSEFALKLRSSIYENGDSPQVQQQIETNKKLDKVSQQLAEYLGYGRGSRAVLA